MKIHLKSKTREREAPIRMKFSDSPVSKELLRYFNEKFIETIAPIALLKCVAVVSCKLRRPRVSVLHVAPSRHLKSYTSDEVMKIFADNFWIDAQSDFTIHSLEKYKEQLKESRCLFINDGTTLFASKSKRTKERLVGGLSEFVSDESYTYQDFNRKFTLEGKVTLIMNMTSEAFKNYKNRLLGLTLAEKFFTLHYALTRLEMDAWVAKEEESRKIHFKHEIAPSDIETNVKEIPQSHLNSIRNQAREFSYASSRGYIGCQDLIKGTLRAHASLNNRKEICDDDFSFLRMIKDYLPNPFSPYEGRIIEYASRGLSDRGICKRIGKSTGYTKQVHSVVERARIRGIIPIEQGPRHDILKQKASTLVGNTEGGD